MEKRRQAKILAIIAIIIAILSMGFSFASMSTKLDIKGVATMGSSSWDVHFEQLSHATLFGQAIEITHPTITDNSTTISTYDVKFLTTNDGISYDFKIVNDGGMDAKITTLNLTKPLCEGSGASKLSDEQLVCKNLKYTLSYSNGVSLKVGDVLRKGQSVDVRVKLYYDGADLPLEEVKISELGISLIYSQN